MFMLLSRRSIKLHAFQLIADISEPDSFGLEWEATMEMAVYQWKCLWMNTLMSKIWHQKFRIPWWILVKTQTGEVSCFITSLYVKYSCSGVTVIAVSTEKYLSPKSFESTKWTWYTLSIHYICTGSNEKKSRNLWFLVFWETGLWDTALYNLWSCAQFTGKEGLSIEEKQHGFNIVKKHHSHMQIFLLQSFVLEILRSERPIHTQISSHTSFH